MSAVTNEKQNNIKLLLVDDHPTVRNGLKLCLSQYEGIEIVGEAGNGSEAIEIVQAAIPDVVLMDVSMPGMNGIDTTELLLERLPDLKVLMFSMHEDAEFVSNAVGSGAKGYVLKNASPDEIFYAIQSVNSGGTHFSSDIVNKVVGNPVRSDGERLTSREQHILAYIADGLSSKEIARELTISVRTVEAHRRNIKTKLECNSVAEMVKYAIDHNILSR